MNKTIFFIILAYPIHGLLHAARSNVRKDAYFDTCVQEVLAGKPETFQDPKGKNKTLLMASVLKLRHGTSAQLLEIYPADMLNKRTTDDRNILDIIIGFKKLNLSRKLELMRELFKRKDFDINSSNNSGDTSFDKSVDLFINAHNQNSQMAYAGVITELLKQSHVTLSETTRTKMQSHRKLQPLLAEYDQTHLSVQTTTEDDLNHFDVTSHSDYQMLKEEIHSQANSPISESKQAEAIFADKFGLNSFE